jgi:hypothetical protein
LPDFTRKIREHIVEVDNGTGVLVQPALGECSFVVTAKHVIETGEGTGVYKSSEEVGVRLFDGTPIEISSIYIDEEADLAIMSTQKRLNIDLLPAIARPERGENVLFYGYPSTRRNGNADDRIREFEGQVNESSDTRFIVTLQNVPDWGQVVGASGGGIFIIIGEDIFLYGIESRMEGDVDAEHHGRVVCLPLLVIEALIIKEKLALIHPPAMVSFVGLISQTFNYYDEADDPRNIRFLKSRLHERARLLSVSHEVSPLNLYKEFEAALLISNSPSQDLYANDLWIAYFEFLVISCLVDEIDNIDFSYVEENFTKRRFLFSAQKENWVWRLMDIFRSDFRGLRRDGKIIISTGDRSGKLKAKTEQIQNVVMDIGRGDVSALMVDSAIVNPAKEFEVLHLTGLHKVCVLDNENELGRFYAGGDGCGESELINRIRCLYHEYI